MTPPRATYRLQLHAGFGFDDAAAVVPYIARLGISHLYLSPILAARRGSPHGYDVVDPTRINLELGGEPGLHRLAAAARTAGLGIVLDIVPNHMAVGPENPWWQDVLAQGRASPWATTFDIDWQSEDPALAGKVLCPFLDRPYGEALAAGALTLEADVAYGFAVRHHDTLFPVAQANHRALAAAGLAAFDPAMADGRQRLHALLERQHYRLAWWRVAGDTINWRRFFDIGELVSIRVEDPAVFAATHAVTLRLWREGLVDGLRVDHVDGLADPEGYCRRLRQALAEAAPDRTPWLLVEKILAEGERVPDGWGVDGTTGYDFMDEVGALLHHPDGAGPLGRLWAERSGRPADFAVEEVAARRQILDRGFSAQLDGAVAALHRLARLDPRTRDTARPAIRRCLAALLAHFPVYRTYVGTVGRSPDDQTVFAQAAAAARADLLPADHAVLDAIDGWLGGTAAPPGLEGPYRLAATRFQQLTAPVAAKSVEDTAFYRHGRLLSRNEVGSNPGIFARPAEAFHAAQARRLAQFPAAMLATATHDHKRGEDVRARLAVLSEMPDAWAAAVAGWLPADGAPSRGDALMLCQMLVGAWPLELAPGDRAGIDRFATRVGEWQLKALREAKLATEWTVPDEGYEAAARAFLDRLLATPATAAALAAFAGRIAPAGAVNGLAQLLLRLTAPGVPDTYQGTEGWDLSLVDPDNRRPVDYARLDAELGAGGSPEDLAASWRDGRVKQAVLARALAFRAERPALFAAGEYHPIQADGARAAHVVAFARRRGDMTAITVVPRWPSTLLDGAGDAIAIPAAAWGDTRLPLPATGQVRDVLTGRTIAVTGGALALADLLPGLPVALLANG